MSIGTRVHSFELYLVYQAESSRLGRTLADRVRRCPLPGRMNEQKLPLDKRGSSMGLAWCTARTMFWTTSCLAVVQKDQRGSETAGRDG